MFIKKAYIHTFSRRLGQDRDRHFESGQNIDGTETESLTAGNKIPEF